MSDDDIIVLSDSDDVDISAMARKEIDLELFALCNDAAFETMRSVRVDAVNYNGKTFDEVDQQFVESCSEAVIDVRRDIRANAAISAGSPCKKFDLELDESLNASETSRDAAVHDAGFAENGKTFDEVDLELFESRDEVRRNVSVDATDSGASQCRESDLELIESLNDAVVEVKRDTDNGIINGDKHTEIVNDASNNTEKPKRRKRTREEIEQEKLLKEVNKVRREMNAAKNSKCESYLFCYLHTNILAIDEFIHDELVSRFTERSISEQLIFTDKGDMNVLWKKKRVSAFIEDGKFHSTSTMEPSGIFATVLDGTTFTTLVKTQGVIHYVENQLDGYKPTEESQLTVVVIGKCDARESVMNDVLFEAFERYRVQFRFAKNALDFSFLIAQLHRAIAKQEKKMEYNMMQLPIIAIEKGIREGPRLVEDWWTRMLEQMHRLSEDQKRALLQVHPSPFSLMDFIGSHKNAGDAIFALANLEVTKNKRLGPVVAQKIYTMLTSFDGKEVLFDGS